MVNEITAQITRTEAQIKRTDATSPEGSNKLVYLQGKLRDLRGLLPKPKVTLHVAEESACLSCE